MELELELSIRTIKMLKIRVKRAAASDRETVKRQRWDGYGKRKASGRRQEGSEHWVMG